MKITLRIALALAVLAIGSPASGGEGALAGLRDGFGASAFSLGNAFTATASDPTGLVYNPAGPAQIKRFFITSGTVSHGAGSFASRAALDFGRQYVAGSLTTPKSGTFSLLWRHFGVGDIEQRLTRDDASTSTFDYKEDWFSAGWSYGLIPKRFFFGVGANYAKMSFDYGSSPGASALGATVGVLYTGVPKLRLGAAVESKMELTHEDDREDTSPGRGRAGLAVGPLGNWLTLAVDLEQIHDEPLKAHAGARIEYRPRGTTALQSVYAGGGVSNWALEDLGSGFDTDNQRRYSGGAGAVIALGNVSLAAGYAVVSSRFGLDHNLSLSLLSSP